jgi:hypothetical protein
MELQPTMGPQFAKEATETLEVKEFVVHSSEERSEDARYEQEESAI